MQLATQTKILRAIQEGEIQRVGATKIKKVDVRLLAATHKNLESMVKEKSFREDLYYRLNVVSIKTPALRNRMEDCPELIDFMLQRLNKKARERLLKYQKRQSPLFPSTTGLVMLGNSRIFFILLRLFAREKNIVKRFTGYNNW